MTIDILTLFPEMFKGPFEESILKRAQKNGLIKINLHNLRDWAKDPHKTVDDSPYGGGAGMVLRIDILDRAINSLKLKMKNLPRRQAGQKSKIILLTPQGRQLNQVIVKKLSKKKRLILVCGHYEGFDERVRKLVDEEISIGPYVLTGGEIPAMVIVDAVSRLIPGVLGKNESASEDSFSMDNFLKNSKIENRKSKMPTFGWLEYPHYTRPESYQPISKKYTRSLKVPAVLLSGNHQKIRQWRLKQAILKSKKFIRE